MLWIAERAPGARLDLLVADLSSLAATRQAAMLIDARFPQIDLLVNNVGMFATRREETEEGHERVLATNHLSAFVMTRALVPGLRAAAKTHGQRASSRSAPPLPIMRASTRRTWRAGDAGAACGPTANPSWLR